MAFLKFIQHQKTQLLDRISICTYKKIRGRISFALGTCLWYSCYILRLFNVYGPRSRTSGNIWSSFWSFSCSKTCPKPIYCCWRWNQTRDFTFVSDVVEAMIIASLSKIKNEVFNVGSGKQFLWIIVKLLRGDCVFIPERPGEPKVTFAMTRKNKQQLNWSPKVSIEKVLIFYLIILTIGRCSCLDT